MTSKQTPGEADRTLVAGRNPKTEPFPDDLPHILLTEYSMEDILEHRWEVEYTDEFALWWETLSIAEQESIAASVRLLEALGPQLRYPHSSGIAGAKQPHLRELRTQHHGRPYRTLYAFDPRRVAILLIGGDKTGNDRWYEQFVPIADELYNKHMLQLMTENLIHGQKIQ